MVLSVAVQTCVAQKISNFVKIKIFMFGLEIHLESIKSSTRRFHLEQFVSSKLGGLAKKITCDRGYFNHRNFFG